MSALLLLCVAFAFLHISSCLVLSLFLTYSTHSFALLLPHTGSRDPTQSRQHQRGGIIRCSLLPAPSLVPHRPLRAALDSRASDPVSRASNKLIYEHEKQYSEL